MRSWYMFSFIGSSNTIFKKCLFYLFFCWLCTNTLLFYGISKFSFWCFCLFCKKNSAKKCRKNIKNYFFYVFINIFRFFAYFISVSFSIDFLRFNLVKHFCFIFDKTSFNFFKFFFIFWLYGDNFFLTHWIMIS